jgi:hypothetical protein
MSIGFFIVGGVIFAVYMYFTLWNIFYSSKKQREENYPNYLNQNDIMDMDGMGNFSRFPTTKEAPKKRRLTKSQKKVKL